MYTAKLAKHRPCSLILLRIVIGAIFLTHGYMKWSSFETATPLFKILAIAEPLGGIAVMIGMLTRWASAGLAVIMLGAMYTKIGNVGVLGFAGKGGWEFDAIIFAGTMVLLMHGPGKWALDVWARWEKKE